MTSEDKELLFHLPSCIYHWAYEFEVLTKTMKMTGSICGGNHEEAEKRLKSAHCKEHIKFNVHCKNCLQAYIDAVDANFMALME